MMHVPNTVEQLDISIGLHHCSPHEIPLKDFWDLFLTFSFFHSPLLWITWAALEINPEQCYIPQFLTV